MSSRLNIRPASAAEPQPPAEAGPDAAQLQTLAQLVEQIDDAVLVVENPQLAVQLLVGQNGQKAA
jgi:hypothetical protein